MPACWIKVISQILPQIGCHSNVPKGIKKRSRSRKFTQVPFIWWKDRESRPSRFWDNLAKVKKEEIAEGKIYSPVGKFAERAKLCMMWMPKLYWCFRIRNLSDIVQKRPLTWLVQSYKQKYEKKVWLNWQLKIFVKTRKFLSTAKLHTIMLSHPFMYCHKICIQIFRGIKADNEIFIVDP